MNPLSAINSIPSAMPGMPTGQPPQPPAGKARIIPPSEVEKLNPTPGLPISGAGRSVGGSGSFERVLSDFVGEVNRKQVESADKLRSFYTGGKVSLHEVMISGQEANLSFQLMVEVRNKLLDAYKELMRMQM